MSAAAIFTQGDFERR